MLIDDALTFLGIDIVTGSIGRKEIRVLLKEAFKVAYEESLMADPTFYTKSQTFSAATTINYPALYRSTICVRITDNSCYSKGARKIELDEWQLIAQNAQLAGDANDPTYQNKATALELSTSLAGIHYYFQTIDEALLLIDSTDVYTLIPRPMVPTLIVKIMELALARHFQNEEIPSELIKMLEQSTNTARSLTTFLSPIEQNEQEGQAPTYAAGRGRQPRANS